LLGGDVLGSAVGDATLAPTAVEQVETQVLAPWMAGRLAAARRLYEVA
jgi:hypothetical protein